MPTPTQPDLYQKVKAEADKKFLAPTSVYKSAWIVAEYKRRGGTYKEDGRKKGLTQWFREKWVDLERPIQGPRGRLVGYEACGRDAATTKGTYPVCRPSKRVNASTPRTVAELSGNAIQQAEKAKQQVKHKGRVRFAVSGKTAGGA